LRVRGTVEHSDAAAPDELQPPWVLTVDTRGRGEGSPKQAAERRVPWAGVIGAGPLQVGTRRRLWRPAVLSRPKSPSGRKLPPPLQPPRLGALLPLPSCLLPCQIPSHEAPVSRPCEPASREDSGFRTHDMSRLDIGACTHAGATGVTRADPASDYFTTSCPLLHAHLGPVAPSARPSREVCSSSPRISMAPVCSLHGQMHCTGTSRAHQSPSTTPNRPAIHGLSVLS